MKLILLFSITICLSIAACSTVPVQTKVVEGPTKYVAKEPPAAFLVIRPAPTLTGDTCQDYIEYGLACKATLEKKNQDTRSILGWLESFEKDQ